MEEYAHLRLAPMHELPPLPQSSVFSTFYKLREQFGSSQAKKRKTNPSSEEDSDSAMEIRYSGSGSSGCESQAGSPDSVVAKRRGKCVRPLNLSDCEEGGLYVLL